MKYFNSKYIFLTALGIVLIWNLVALKKDTTKTYLLKKSIGYQFLGIKFLGLNEVFKDIPVVGYYTDKNLDNNRDAMQFAQAQLMLAPTVLDLNNTDLEYIIFDCTSPLAAVQKMKEINAAPFKKNQFGIILARRVYE